MLNFWKGKYKQKLIFFVQQVITKPNKDINFHFLMNMHKPMCSSNAEQSTFPATHYFKFLAK